MPKKTSGVNLKEFMSVQGFSNPRFESLRTPIGRMTIHFEAVIRTAALCQHKGQRAKLPFGQIGKFDSQVKRYPYTETKEGIAMERRNRAPWQMDYYTILKS